MAISNIRHRRGSLEGGHHVLDYTVTIVDFRIAHLSHALFELGKRRLGEVFERLHRIFELASIELTVGINVDPSDYSS